MVVFLNGVVGVDARSLFDLVDAQVFLLAHLVNVKVNKGGRDGPWLGLLLVKQVPALNFFAQNLNFFYRIYFHFELLSYHFDVFIGPYVHLRNIFEDKFGNFQNLVVVGVYDGLKGVGLNVDEAPLAGQVD